MIAPRPAPSAPTSILIVDDEADNCELLEAIFAWEGYRISVAGSGKAALASVAADPPDIIVLDVMMPRMDGYAVTTALRAAPATREIPVILLSALTDNVARARGLAAGADDFMTKPVERATLVTCVRRLLGARRAQKP